MGSGITRRQFLASAGAAVSVMLLEGVGGPNVIYGSEVDGASHGMNNGGGRVVDPLEVGPTTPGWEAGYQERLERLVYAQIWPIESGWGDADSGKRAWPGLLAEMWKVRDDPTAIDNLIATKGHDLIFSPWAGSFYKPFSVPGYTLYYLQYKDRLPKDQKDRVREMLYSPNNNPNSSESGWQELMRPDGHMDPIYGLTEFNSENFDWMARLGGYLWAHEFNDPDYIPYFDNYVNNWVRAIYNTGRIEWNSHIYWGYVFQPALVLYEFAVDPKVKRQAKAVLDWLVLEAAIHYRDGGFVGPESRGKHGPFPAFSGSISQYVYLYFVDSHHHPSYSDDYVLDNASVNLVGYVPYSSYRPPQVAIDLAHRKYHTPLEIHSAKPFYRLDYDNYADWKGNTERSRRFEFETLYVEESYTLGSLATYRPNGFASFGPEHQRPFSEENVWRLGIEGTDSGVVQIYGNAGDYVDAGGRWPYEEIGQYRNAMMRLFKHTDRAWVVIPDDVTVEFEGDTAYADLGQGVYVALIPYNVTGHSVTEYSHAQSYKQYIWNLNSSGLAALAMEVGTGREHGSYERFKGRIRSRTGLTRLGPDGLEYKSTHGSKLRVRYQPTTTYRWVDGSILEPAGVPPKVWANGRYLDYSNWHSYEVMSGDQQVVRQPWGSGILKASAGSGGLQISVDDTADVSYHLFGHPGTTNAGEG